MEKSKLIRVLKSFQNTELREFGQFVASPFFNQREDVYQLYRLIESHFKDEKPQLNKQEAFELLFPGQAYHSTDFYLLMSYLYRLVKQYIIQKTIAKEEFQQDLLLMQGFRERGLVKDFQHTTSELEKKLDKQPLRNSAFYDLSFQRQWQSHQLISAQRPSDETHLRDMSHTLDVAFIGRKLRHLCLLAAHQSVYHSDFDLSSPEELLTYARQRNLLEVPAVGIYYHCFQMLRIPEQEEHFLAFKKLLFQQGGCFDASETRDLFTQAVNYCVRQANVGKSDYLQELFELYKLGLEKEYLMENKVLSRFAYHNITGVGIRVQAYDWVEDFIEKYRHTLERKFRQASFNFNKARLEYSRKNYSNVLDLLQTANYRDLLLNLAAKTLLLKTYYELDELDLLYSHLDAMNTYVRRKTTIGYHKANYQKLIYYTRKLMATNFYDKKALEKLEQQINAEENLPEKDWLLLQLMG